ncbi:PREDICTED: putative inactive cadmium/zinc-transporting ATPase HMA3 [Ipomoea nil]|uniref:putative inactive cadmium/zinc-transporting ATPase HMA3 n=1 Tax=Ipomoea nil TaxID=35883 RepID=UPI000901D266|nr:PREDICTED: putative inactive cadmium/zinc-transporting ATPase HMA3 [Ipomoea nil]
MREKNINNNGAEKSYFDVIGICCPSEVPLIDKILKGLDGVHEVSVMVTTKTVVVVHDPLLITQHQIVRALNKASLEASIKVNGETNDGPKMLPSPYAVVCGILLLLSFLKYVYAPLKWLAVAAAVAGSFPVLRRAVAALRNLTLDINILMIISVVGSIVLHDYWEAATIVFLFTTGEWLESRASHKAMAAMSSLVNVVSQRAVLAETGEILDANQVKVDTILAVKAGEVIPIDGIVVEGECEVDEKTLTGESFSVPKQKDSTVWAATINLNGYISIKTTAVAEDCAVARMAKLVEEAQSNKSRAQRSIDKIAKYYTPAIVAISACLAISAVKVENRSERYHLALVVLVSACPCALVLSTPVAMFCALSRAAALGLLFKGAEYLEILAKVKVIAFDKTGTITRGEFTVAHFSSLLDGINHNTLLSWVSSIESKSSHPMAPAIIDYAQSHSVEPNPEKVEHFQNFPGEGIYGEIDGMEIYIGNKKISARAGCTSVPEFDVDGREGKSMSYIFVGSSLAGVFSLSDACRTGAQEAIRKLKVMGIKTVMLTGDSYAAARHVQEQLGGALDEFHAELLPEEKAQIIKKFQKGGRTGMIGDGLNDAPALATADVGISMGISGSNLAQETGHVILMTNDIGRIGKAIELGRRVWRKVIVNIVVAICTKAAIMALAIAGHPLVWAAVLVDVGTCLVVIFNSTLLLRGGDREAPKRRKKCCKSSSATKKHKCSRETTTTTTKSSSHRPSCCSKSESRKTCKSSRRCSAKKCGSRFGKKSCAPSSCSSKISCAKDHGCHQLHANNAAFHVHSDCSDNSTLHKHDDEHSQTDTRIMEEEHHCEHGADEDNHCEGSTEPAEIMHDCSELHECHRNNILGGSLSEIVVE